MESSLFHVANHVDELNGRENITIYFSIITLLRQAPQATHLSSVLTFCRPRPFNCFFIAKFIKRALYNPELAAYCDLIRAAFHSLKLAHSRYPGHVRPCKSWLQLDFFACSMTAVEILLFLTTMPVHPTAAALAF